MHRPAGRPNFDFSKFLLLHKVCTSGLTGVVFWPNRVQSPSCRRNRCAGPAAPSGISRQVVGQIMRGFYAFFTNVHSTLVPIEAGIGFGSCLARNKWQRHGVFGVFGHLTRGKKLGQPYDGFRVVDGPPARRVCVVPGGPAHVHAPRRGPPSNRPRSVRRQRPRRRRARRFGFG